MHLVLINESELAIQIQDRMLEAGKVIAENAKSVCPVDTGQLRDSIEAVAISEHEVEIGSKLEYAKFVEYGTSKMAARPFLRTGLAMSVGALQRIWGW